MALRAQNNPTINNSTMMQNYKHASISTARLSQTPCPKTTKPQNFKRATESRQLNAHLRPANSVSNTQPQSRTSRLAFETWVPEQQSRTSRHAYKKCVQETRTWDLSISAELRGARVRAKPVVIRAGPRNRGRPLTKRYLTARIVLHQLPPCTRLIRQATAIDPAA